MGSWIPGGVPRFCLVCSSWGVSAWDCSPHGDTDQRMLVRRTAANRGRLPREPRPAAGGADEHGARARAAGSLLGASLHIRHTLKVFALGALVAYTLASIRG